MNKLHTGILLIFIIFTAQNTIAQKINWGEAKKVKHGLFQYPIGEDEGVSYRLGASDPLFGYDGAEVRKISHFYILKYSNGSDVPEAIKVKTDYELYQIKGSYILNKKIIVLYKTFKGGYSVDFYADIFDESGKRERTVALIDKKTNSEKKMLDKYMDIYTSDSNKWILVQFGEIYKMFDKDLNNKWERTLSKAVVSKINVTNSGEVFMTTHQKDDENSYSVIKVDSKNKLSETAMGTASDIYYDQNNDLVYAVTYNGAVNKGHMFNYGTHTDLKISNSFSYAVYQGEDMKKLDEQKNIAFHDKIIKEAMDKDEVNGLVGLELKSVILSNMQTPIFIFDTRANTSSGSFARPECIVLVKMVSEDETVQKLVTKTSDKLRFIISNYNVFYNGKEICLLYYTFEEDKKGFGDYVLNSGTYNQDLENVSKSMINSTKEYGYSVNILHYYKKSAHTYLFFGLAIHYKTGIAELNF